MLMEKLIYANYATVLIVLFMVVFLLSNVSFERRIVRLFMIAVMTALVLVVVDSVESYTETLSYPTMLRVLMSAIGYSVRPICILCVLLIIVKDSRMRTLLMLPIVINAVIAFSALFTDWAFSYSSTNEFVRGPLGFSAYITSGFYLVMLCIETIKYIQLKNYNEALIVFGIAFISVLSIFLEAVYKFEGFINVSIAISVSFYYLYYHTQNYKNDSLTGALNRLSYDVDVVRNVNSITAMISLDLNNLKAMNDTYGHAAGDKALITVAQCVQRNLVRGCSFYRVGGDEFEIIYVKDDVQKLSKMIDNIRNDVQKHSYSCAVGMAVRMDKEQVKDLAARADAFMYEDKMRIKGKR